MIDQICVIEREVAVASGELAGLRQQSSVDDQVNLNLRKEISYQEGLVTEQKECSHDAYKELTALRLKKEKTLSDNSTNLLMELSDALQEAYQDLSTYIDVGAPEVLKVEEEDEIDDTTLLLETNRVLAESYDPEI